MCIAAEVFPHKTIKFIVGLTPGSGSDSSARFVATGLAPLLGQAVVVENRPGANGVIAVQAVLSAPPDGHTLYLASNSPLSVNPIVIKNLPYDPEHDLKPISGIFRGPSLFVVPSSSSYKTMSDLIAEGARARDAIDIGTYAQGYWLAAAMFANLAGIQFNNIPYKGAAQTLSDVVGGHVGLAFMDQSAVRSLLTEHKLRALAVASEKRHAKLPDVPTVKELGIGDFTHYSWVGIYVHARTPDDVSAKLTAAVQKVLDTKEFAAFIDQQGFEPMTLAPAAMRKFQLEETQRYRAIAGLLGFRPE